MEKSLSLSFDEAAALLEMTLYSSIEIRGEAAERARQKLSNLCRRFYRESHPDNPVKSPTPERIYTS